MDEFLSHYKSQQTVERGFRFLKSPDFFAESKVKTIADFFTSYIKVQDIAADNKHTITLK